MMNENYASQKAAYAEDACATRVTEVQGELGLLNEMAHHVHEAAMTLCNRLAFVQRIGAPIAGVTGTAAAPQPALCPMASELRNIRELMQSTVEMIEANRNQLEI